jgi:hypothetical protein
VSAKAKRINPHAPEKVAQLKATGASMATVKRGGLLPALAELSQPETALREVPAAEGSPHHVLVIDGLPTTEQRVEMAKRVQQHQGRGAYVQLRRLHEAKQQQPQPEEQVMTKKGEATAGALPAGVDVKEIEAAHAANAKEVAEREKEKAAEAAAKLKAEEKKRTAQAKARKRDATPKTKPKPEQTAAAKPAAKATAPAKGGRPAKAADPDQKYRVVKDNTRSGHMKVFMAKAAELKTFTRQSLVDATKGKVTADRAERYFDYCLYKRLIGEAK